MRELGEGERRDSEIEPAQAQRRQGNRQTDGGGDDGAGGKGEPERPTQPYLQQTGAVGADPEHRGIGEGQLARIAQQDIETNGQQHVDQDRVADEHVVVADQCRRRGRDEQQRQEDIAPAEQGHRYTRRKALKPSRPEGRSTSTSMMTMKAETSMKLELM